MHAVDKIAANTPTASGPARNLAALAVKVKVKGIAIELGGEIRVVPPLSLGALERLEDGLSAFTGDVRDKAQITLMTDAAHAALKRNYPDVTREEVAEWIDLENMIDVMNAVMDTSGMNRKAAEAAKSVAPQEECRD